MKIGDEIWVHGFIDEIRQDMCVVKNKGGYFATIESEILNSKPNVEEDNSIKVGDVVLIDDDHYLGKGVVTYIVDNKSRNYNVLISNGNSLWCMECQLKKTGENIPYIIEALEQLQENSHD